MNDKMREEFDAWWLHGVYPLRRMDRFEDAGVSEELAQEIWQASRESLVIKLPAIRAEDYCPLSNVAYREECRETIESAGLKVQP
jgi:hypothetical protein